MSVNPAGQPTTYSALYDVETSDFCGSDGQGRSRFVSVPEPVPATDAAFHDVSVDLAGLTPGSGYCAKIRATNGSSSATSQRPARFAGGEPVSVGSQAIPTGPSSAAVTGRVDPNEQPTMYRVLADLGGTFCKGRREPPSVVEPAYSVGDDSRVVSDQADIAMKSTSWRRLGVADKTFHRVSSELTGLLAGARYCVAIQTTNGSNTTTGVRDYFTAGTPRAPIADIEQPIATGSTTATLTGLVNPAAQATTYRLLYDAADSAFCPDEEEPHAYEEPRLAVDPALATRSTPSQPLGATDGAGHAVAIDIAGLTPGARYCAMIEASNATGTSLPSLVEFTAGVPDAARLSRSGRTRVAVGRRGRIVVTTSVVARCPPGGGACRGSARIVAAPRGARAGPTLGVRSLVVPARRTVAVRLTLSGPGAARLRAQPRGVRARVAATLRGATGPAVTSSRIITLRVPAAQIRRPTPR